MDSMDQDLTQKMESQRGDSKTSAPFREWRTSRVYRAGVLPAMRLLDAAGHALMFPLQLLLDVQQYPKHCYLIGSP